jgi:hypothetical protein
MPGGERFNSQQSNEDRRAFSNLLLLCQKHHTITNDVTGFPVAKLKGIKRDHEAKYTDVVTRIRNSVVDRTKSSMTKRAKTGARINRLLKWEHEEPDLKVVLEEINQLAVRLARVPRSTREFLAIVAERGESSRSGLTDGTRALHDDVVEACETNDNTVVKHVGILEHHSLGYGDEYSGEIVLTGLEWDVWGDLKRYCQRANIDLAEVIVEGRFDLLD